ncbi:hypothetical protein CYMTET_12816, partial [Cymbomonas tetramitiformis]
MNAPSFEDYEKLPKSEVAVLRGHEGPVLAVRFNHNGQYCLTCGKDRTIRLWNPHRELCIKSYEGHGQEVRDVVATVDNSRLASCGGDKQVFYWDVPTGRTIRRFRGHDGAVNSVVFGGDCSVVVTAGYDQAVKFWDCRSQSIDAIQTLTGFKDSVSTVRVQGTCVVAGSVDGTVRTYDVRRGRVTTDDLVQPVTFMQLSHDHRCVVAGCLDATIRLMDRASGQVLNTFEGHTNTSLKLECCTTNSDAYVVNTPTDTQAHPPEGEGKKKKRKEKGEGERG